MTGVPFTRSSPDTCSTPRRQSTRSSRTSVRPTGFGRCGLRVLNTPTRRPPSAGGATLAGKTLRRGGRPPLPGVGAAFMPDSRAVLVLVWNRKLIHTWLCCSSPSNDTPCIWVVSSSMRPIASGTSMPWRGVPAVTAVTAAQSEARTGHYAGHADTLYGTATASHRSDPGTESLPCQSQARACPVAPL